MHLSPFQRNPNRTFFHPPPRTPKPSSALDSRALRTQCVIQLRNSNQLSAYKIATVLECEGLASGVSSIASILRQADLPHLLCRPASRILEAAHPLQAPPPTAAPSASPNAPSAPPSAACSCSCPCSRFDELVASCGLPGSDAIPTACACRSLLALMLWGIGRPARVRPNILDDGLVLFGGLNSLPKRSSLTEYSCRIDPRLLPHWSAVWLDAVKRIGLPRGASFDLDFHTIPYHGVRALIKKHYVSKRRRRQNGVLAFLIRDAAAGVFCYAAAVQKSAQNDAILRFIGAFEKRTGALPAELTSTVA